MASAVMKLSSDCALEMIFQGTMIQPPVIVIIMTPRCEPYQCFVLERMKNLVAYPDVDVLWEEVRQVIGRTDDVGRQVRSDLSYDPTESYKEGSAATGGTIPFRSEGERIPNVFAVNNLGGRGGDDTKKP